jgi:hypothetical protein
MTKDEIQKVTLGTNEALRVTAEGEFIWHPEADAMIEKGDFTSSPAMRHILRALRKALAAPVQEPWKYRRWNDEAEKWGLTDDCGWPSEPLYTTPFAAPDLQAELDATNRQVEILSDALAESRREVDAMVAGALFDFMGWLTSRDQRLTLSSTDEASPAVEAITEFAKMRGLLLVDARVQDWQDTTPPAAQRPWVGLTEHELESLWYQAETGGAMLLRFAEAIEAKLKERNT